MTNAHKSDATQKSDWVETLEHDLEIVAHEPPPRLFLRLLRLDLPYIAMLSAAVLGVGYVSFVSGPSPLIWEWIVPLFALACIAAGWRHTFASGHFMLILKQALHWSAVLVAMNLAYLPSVRSVANNATTGLMLMTILALATFLAGLHIAAWQICVVGLLLALAVPGVAWIEQSAVLITVVLVGLIFLAFVGASLWWTFRHERRVSG
ncbi:hypothetical protein [Methylovirgula sp. 4M-Z18]|uniref:hypothetical protein n=1 Tax=Methylovirgula sp. 4M-Z18 TaxID=2293567 RepID=UPI000E2F855C|nr:hypothetical protein [Methylovirgula sp. 4M-Z18]RFB76486.1 hypothetical protein DYH55_20315 [Methylovirgula sp. 4M-Z18]